ncbi:carboxymuconolactone decarboxylase family protein [Phascolarctobacterium sp.]
MKNFISMFLMTSLLLGGMTFTIGKMSVCAASKNRVTAAQEKQTQLFGGSRNNLAKTDPDFAAVMDNFIYGDVYNRGKLTDKQRELLTITTLTAAQSFDTLPEHINAALKAGATPIEIKETIYQCAPYVGFPKTVSALEISNKIFAKQGIRLPLPDQATVTEATRFEDGFQVQSDIFGAEHIAALHKNSPANQKHIANYLSEFCFGDTYTRSGLNLQMRELITLCAISTIGGAEPQVKAHVQANLNVGNDKELLLDAVTQCLPYIGFPRTLNAIACINQIIPDNA